MISNREIIENMTADEKFKIICRIKGFDIEEIGQEIYSIIENSEYEDKKEYIDICWYQDEYMDEYLVHYVNIDRDMLNTKNDWIESHINEYEDLSYEEAEQMDWHYYVFGDEFNDKQKEFIQLALECGVDRILLKWM